MDAIVKLNGLDEVTRKLNQLSFRVGQNASRRALRKGANVIRDMARRNASLVDDPQTRENIAKNITTQAASSRRQKREKAVIMRVGVMGGARLRRGDNGNPGGNTTYWRYLEFGTSETPARPFMRNAIAQGADRAISVTVDALRKEVDKELSKMGVTRGT